jgi:hypothetical protein
VSVAELIAAGAPVEQGQAQGARFAREIATEIARQQRALPWLARRALVRRVRAHSARAVATQLPWQRERSEGIALSARVSIAGLELAEALARIPGAAFRDGARLAAAFDVPPALAPLLFLRESRPDAGGFASVELALAPLAGCLCGVNSEGLAAIVVRDLGRDEPSLRFHAQELLFRARDLDAGIDHLRRRAAYAGGTGELVVAARGIAPRRVVLRRGALEIDDADLPREPAAPDVVLDLERGTVEARA